MLTNNNDNRKTLRLTILLDSHISKDELASMFGTPTEITLTLKYLQFHFPSVTMLTSIQLTPIYNLLVSYEKQHTSLRFKMFHLYNEVDGTYSPISLQALRGEWAVISSTSELDIATSSNLLTLI